MPQWKVLCVATQTQNNKQIKKKERKKTDAVISTLGSVVLSWGQSIFAYLWRHCLSQLGGVPLVSSGQRPRMLPTILYGNDSHSQQRLAWPQMSGMSRLSSTRTEQGAWRTQALPPWPVTFGAMVFPAWSC